MYIIAKGKEYNKQGGRILRCSHSPQEQMAPDELSRETQLPRQMTWHNALKVYRQMAGNATGRRAVEIWHNCQGQKQ